MVVHNKIIPFKRHYIDKVDNTFSIIIFIPPPLKFCNIIYSIFNIEFAYTKAYYNEQDNKKFG